jgi:hypothetical protein
MEHKNVVLQEAIKFFVDTGHEMAQLCVSVCHPSIPILKRYRYSGPLNLHRLKKYMGNVDVRTVGNKRRSKQTGRVGKATKICVWW